jgi:hypothetical protein
MTDLSARKASATSRVFISHDSRDAALAKAFATLLTRVSAGFVKCFRSSDKSGTQGIDFGDEWYRALMSNLDAATDVVCLLTDRSVERPWILYEAGVAKGKLGTPVHGVILGARQLSSGPFCQFQNCDDSEESLSKLVLQLCRRVQGLKPDEEVIRDQIKVFRQVATEALKTQVKASGNTSWRRAIPLKDKLPADVVKRVGDQLDAARYEVKQFFEERGKPFATDDIRSNLLLPDCQFRDKSQFPGQLCFFAARPSESYSKQELSNRFAPGEGVSGKVFLDGVPFAEDGRVGVSAKKLKVMPRRLSGVAGFPLLNPDVQYAFGVVSIDFVGVPEVDSQDLSELLGYEYRDSRNCLGPQPP